MYKLIRLQYHLKKILMYDKIVLSYCPKTLAVVDSEENFELWTA